MKIYLATWLFDKTLGRSCTKLKANKRLLSYYFLIEGKITDEELKKYIKTGRLNPNKKRK